MNLENQIKGYNDLRQLGLNIIPCKPMSKQPLINWLDYQIKICDLPLDQNNNAAVVCGKSSGDLVVIDIDVPEKLDRFFSDFESIKKNTLVVKTGSGGYHVYMRVMDKLPKIMQMIDEMGNPMGEIRGQGGYVISPLSTHPNGNKYEIISETININTFYLENLITGLGAKGINVKKSLPPVEEIVKGVPLGQRDNATFKYTAHLKQTVGLDKETAWVEIQRWAEAIGHNCKKEKLRMTFESAWKRVPSPEIEVMEDEDDINAAGTRLPSFANDTKDVHGLVADKIMTLDHYATIPATGTVYKWKDGVYREYDKGINDLINRMIKFSKKGNRSETFDLIKSRVERTYEEFDADPNIHNLKNGLLNIQTMELGSWSPDYLSLRQYGVNYDPEAICPVYEQALVENLPDSIERQQFIEAMAMCLIPEEKHFKKCGVFYGPSNAGKSSLVAPLEKILGGPEYISSYAIQDFDNDRFACGGLIGKFANITHDMGHGKIKEAHKFKNIIDHRPVETEKKYGHAESIAHKISCIFMVNQLPEVHPDAAEGFFSRIILIEFKQIYLKDPTEQELELGIKKIDKGIVKAIDSETPGIYNLLLKTAKNIKENGLTYDPSPNKVEEKWNEIADPTMWFTNAFITEMFDSNCFVFLDDVYKEYVTRCKECSKIPIPQKRFNHYISQRYAKSDRNDPRASDPRASHKICVTSISINGIGRHDNLKSFDDMFDFAIDVVKRNYNFSTIGGLLECKKCGGKCNLETFKDHICNSTLN